MREEIKITEIVLILREHSVGKTMEELIAIAEDIVAATEKGGEEE
jgi:hypothetical protein